MGGKDLPTKDTEAFSSFVQGRVLLESYLESGLGERLKQACDLFARASKHDANFDLAILYLGVAQTELRDSANAILNLEKLVAKQRYLPEAHLQLAYAHTKRYEGADYVTAQDELMKATEAAKKSGQADLLDLIEAYRLFVLAVRGGRGPEAADKRKAYLEDAIASGEKLLHKVTGEDKPRDEMTAIEFEANNAIGIAFMWMGEHFPTKQDPTPEWDQAEKYFQTALERRPNSVRALQNVGTLRMFQGDWLYAQNRSDEANRRYEAAKTLVDRSLKLNNLDQYPHFQMALLLAKTGKGQEAQQYIDAGRRQKGAVKSDKWDALQGAIKTNDQAKIHGLR